MACRSQERSADAIDRARTRVESLEEQVNALNQLAGRVDAIEVQFLDVRRELSALRSDFVSVRAGAAAMEERLRREIRAGDEETRRQMRVLHEEVIARIALLQEGLGSPQRRAGTSRRQSRKRR
jgi:hypothetical protein